MVGKTISHYKILERLGGGAMGVVYRAEDTRLKRTVALKFLLPDLTRDPGAKERFIREAQAASSLQHGNICVVYDIDETDDGRLFISMECLDGETLREKIEGGPLKIDEALEITVQVARGLTRAHEQGIVHRDIKPANIIITADGVAKIVDFGLARLPGRTLLTSAGSTLGTAAYMSPEQARGEPADQRTDIWSLGVLLYEMLSGRRPFNAEYENALLYSILNAEPEPVTALRTGIPIELDRIIRKCLAKDPEERYQHTDELSVDLRIVHAPSASPPPSSSGTTVRRLRPTRLILTTVSVVLVVAALGAWLFLRREAGESSQLRQKSIAVLPFSPFGRSFDDTVFAEGIHDDILTQLSKIVGLRVIARTSMVLYRDSKKTPRQIADELDVGYVLEGSTRRTGGKIRITAQLIKTADEGHLWAETYDRNDADVFAVQSDIAQRIASSMETVLSPAEKALVEEIPTKSTEAYDYYVRGNYYWDNYYDSAGNAKAADFYDKATEADPSFAQAFARAAVTNRSVYDMGDRTPARLARAIAEYEKSRALKPDDPVVRWAQADYYENFDTVHGKADRRRMALEEYQKALITLPNWSELYIGVGANLRDEGLLKEAREAFRKHYSLSPMSLTILGQDPWTLSSWLRDWDVARREVDQYIARRPDDPSGYLSKADILIDGFGDFEAARAALEEGMKLPPNQYRPPGFKVTKYSFWGLYYLNGKYRDARASLGNPGGRGYNHWMKLGATLLALNQGDSAMTCFDSALSIVKGRSEGFWKHYLIGYALAWRGEHGKAASELEKAIDPDLGWYERKLVELAQLESAVIAGDTDGALNRIEQAISQPGLLTVWRLRCDPVYNPLRSNPRFQAILAKGEPRAARE